MTTPTNWPNPERPGYPMFPERDGWHALDTGQFIHVWHWYAKQKLWERKPNTDIAHEPKHFSHFLYKGPVLTPAQIAEMLAGSGSGRPRNRKRSAINTITSGKKHIIRTPENMPMNACVLHMNVQKQSAI